MYPLPMMEQFLKYGNPLHGTAARLFSGDKEAAVEKTQPFFGT
jgi:hypothetical protein